jgi:hypothetical protein
MPGTSLRRKVSYDPVRGKWGRSGQVTAARRVPPRERGAQIRLRARPLFHLPEYRGQLGGEGDGTVVAGHFQVADASQRCAVAMAC